MRSGKRDLPESSNSKKETKRYYEISRTEDRKKYSQSAGRGGGNFGYVAGVNECLIGYQDGVKYDFCKYEK